MSGEKHIDIVGMGLGTQDTLTLEAARSLAAAEVVVGSPRLLETLPSDCHAQVFNAITADQIIEALLAATWTRAVVAMSGDVGFFSGARALPERMRQAIPACEVSLLPGISSLQAFAARLGRPWSDWTCVSAHGVDCDLAAQVNAERPLFLITGGKARAERLCEDLVSAGMGTVQVTVGERLGYPNERLCAGSAAELAHMTFDSLSVMLVEPFSSEEQENTQLNPWPYTSSGIPDDLFIRGDVPMTKQEVRAVALAKLRVGTEDTCYDVGAGTGSVSVELARLAHAGRVYAVERSKAACKLIEENKQRFGCHNLELACGQATQALEGLPAPHAVFIGGSAGKLADILSVIRAKNPQVRVCVPCITLETFTQATSLLTAPNWEHVEVSQVSATRFEPAGTYHLMHAQNPVFIVSAQGSGLLA